MEWGWEWRQLSAEMDGDGDGCCGNGDDVETIVGIVVGIGMIVVGTVGDRYKYVLMQLSSLSCFKKYSPEEI